MTRLVVLTDIARGLENDDIQSLVRLLLYTDVLELEGIVAVTSTWQRRAARPRNAAIIRRTIDAYARVLPRLRVHSAGFADAAELHARVACGIPAFGAGPGDGFCDERYDDVPGVRMLLRALERDDPRPLWVALWGGANTLAQAIDLARRTRSADEFDAMLRRVRVYAISDQDAAGHWLRDRYGDRMRWIVSPSPATGGRYYRYATWPGIAADRFGHGSVDGVTGGGFPGADATLVSRAWIRRNIRRGPYGRRYPYHRFIMEGDTPSFLGLIPNGLNVPEHPELGGWGGRYVWGVPPGDRGGRVETHPIWSDTPDPVVGLDGVAYRSPQASIWRWREAFQNDFAARIDWTLAERYTEANHPPVAALAHPEHLTVAAGEKLVLDATPSHDPYGDGLRFRWFAYPAGPDEVRIDEADTSRATLYAPQTMEPRILHLVLAVTDDGTPPLTAYRRVEVEVTAAHARAD